MKFFLLIFAIVIFGAAGYFFIIKSHTTQTLSQYPTSSTQTLSISPTGQRAKCLENQLAATVSTEGAAGNIYGTLVLTNTGKTPCTVVLGNTVTAAAEAKNVIIHDQENASLQTIILVPAEKVYSQVHYPNGPQCQSGISPSHLTLFYKTDKTTIAFHPIPQGTLLVQSCTSPTEKTTIDIWPLAKTPITQ